MMPQKAWSNPELAVAMRAAFRSGIRDARFKRKEGRFDRSGPLTLTPISYLKYGYYRRGAHYIGEGGHGVRG